MILQITETAEKAGDKLLDYGIAGIFILAALFMIWYLLKSHRSERKEWREQSQENHNDLKGLYNKSIDEHSASREVMKELSTIIKTGKR